MQLIWNGKSSLTLVFKPAQSEVTLVTDPFFGDNPKFKPQTASLMASSLGSKETTNSGALEVEHPEDVKKVFEVKHAGEYEVRGVFVTGIDAPLKDGTAHTIYRFDAEGIKVGFLGRLDRVLSTKEVEALGNVDILAVPAGDNGVLSPQLAAQVVTLVEPRAVVPICVDEGSGQYASVDAFKRELGGVIEETAKLKITKAQMPQEEMKVFILSKS